MENEIDVPAFETEINGSTFIVTLHYPSESKVTFSEIISKLLREDVKKAMNNH